MIGSSLLIKDNWANQIQLAFSELWTELDHSESYCVRLLRRLNEKNLSLPVPFLFFILHFDSQLGFDYFKVTD